MKKTVAVIVARKGSERIPNKMHQQIAGESLIVRKARQCKEIENIEEVFVVTDEYCLDAKFYEMGVNVYHPPLEYCQGKDANGMIKNALRAFRSDWVLWAHPTNPFIDAALYRRSLDLMAEIEPEGYNSVFSVNRLQGHFWNENPSPVNFSNITVKHKVATDLPCLFSQNGGIFIRKYSEMVEDGAFIGSRAHMFPMSEVEGWDIDYPWQLSMAQELVEKKWIK